MALFSHQVEGGSLYIASLSLALVFLMAPEDTVWRTKRDVPNSSAISGAD